MTRTPAEVAQLAAGTHIVVIDFPHGVLRERVLPMGAPMGPIRVAQKKSPTIHHPVGVPLTITVAEYRQRQKGQ